MRPSALLILSNPLRFLQRLPQQVLDLPIEAPQVVVRPSLQGVDDLAVDPQEKGLSVRHDDPYW